MQAAESGRESTSRRPTACDACFRRKIKCDSARPRCNWCFHRQTECTYSKHRSYDSVRKKSSSTGRKWNLIDRIRRIDELRAESGLHENKRPSIGQASLLDQFDEPPLRGPVKLLPAPRTIHFAGWSIGNVVPELAGLPTLLPEGLHWIRSKAGVAVPFPIDQSTPWEKPIGSKSPNNSPHSVARRVELPPRKVLQSYLDVYESPVVRALFPVIHPSLFTETIQLAYSAAESESLDETAHADSRACIYALLVLLSGLDYVETCCNLPKPPSIPRDAYFQEAQRLLPMIIRDGFNLDALQATVILAVVGVMTGELQIASHYVSIASRSIIAVGIHTMGNPSQNSQAGSLASHDAPIKSHLRNLFWVCYVMDKDVSLRTGQPHCLRDEDCNLQLPCGYSNHLHSRMAYFPARDIPDGPLFPLELRISQIKSRIFTSLYSYQGMQKSDAELIRAIRELDDELESWRLSLPMELRPTLSYGKDANKHPNVMNMYLILCHLSYYFCVTVVHIVGSRCKAWHLDSTSPGMMNGLKSSLIISVEASRSLLLYLQDAESSISSGSFW
ncbi:fungal-specific transcription factor domain-containing protein [Aspergillus heterothallicus]